MIHDYGWTGVVFWLLVRDIIPFFKDHLFPATIAERKRQQEFRYKMEERTVLAQELLAKGVEGINKTLVVTNERMSVLEDTITRHDKATNDAITLMRERTQSGSRTRQTK
jgi:hypothetical protein